jgi:hypothetical protein
MPEPKNPYRPGAAVPPVHLAGRDSTLASFRAVLRGAPELPANIRMTGLRGVGKSVLLKRFEEVATEQKWAVVRIQLEPRHNTDTSLQQLISTSCDHAIKQISRLNRIRDTVGAAVETARGLVNLTWNDYTLSFGSTSTLTESSIPEALYGAAKAADKRGLNGFILMLDEAQILRDETSRDGEHPLSLLIASMNALQETQLPIGLVLCGLPTLRSNLLKARTYSERMFRGQEIQGLNADAAREAFLQPLNGTGITADEALTDRVIAEVEGYPYFIQLWGAELWQAAFDGGTNQLTAALLDTVQPDIYQRLDTDFYEARVEALTPAEQDLLMATANLPYPPLRTASIQGSTGKTQGNVNVLMGRLADQGVVYRTQKGIYEYTAPKFHQFLGRRALRQTRPL